MNSRPLFTNIFKLKNDNFKTRDFSPLIERFLASVYHNATKLDVTTMKEKKKKVATELSLF